MFEEDFNYRDAYMKFNVRGFLIHISHYDPKWCAEKETEKPFNLKVVPKINFSRSHYHQHNSWFRPHEKLFDSEKYWPLAFEVIDELIRELEPEHFFHIGMDEDHSRSYTQYVTAINTLHSGLKERGLRTIIWNDSACEPEQAASMKEGLLENGSTGIIITRWIPCIEENSEDLLNHIQSYSKHLTVF
jgi:hypothetical protein